jgi:hypothetical protein
MGLVAVDVKNDRGSALDFEQLQLEQFTHDEVYHREIARLNVQDRLKHMALHFAKYAGNLAEAADDDRVVKKAATDTFIIAVSTANILNVRLSELMRPTQAETSKSFPTLLAIHAGRMAAACEKLDHLEDVAFRPIIRDNAVALAAAAADEAQRRGWNIVDLVRVRLSGVKQKMMFHGRI